MHMSTAHPDAKGECSICGELVPRGQLKTHILDHAVKCNQCEKIFAHEGVLNTHVEAVHEQREKRKKVPRKRKPKTPVVANVKANDNVVTHLIAEVTAISHVEGVPQDLRGAPAAAAIVTAVGAPIGQLATHHVLHPPLQGQYQPHAMIPAVPPHVQQINANQIHHFLQMNTQTRYQN